LAYPFGPTITFGRFRKRLEELGCVFKTLRVVDYPDPICYFEREIDGEPIQAVIDRKLDDSPVNPDVIRSVCVRLKIDPQAHFGQYLI